jgi:hypothetical protein
MDATERNRRKRSINTAVAAGVLRYGFSKTKNHWFVRAFPDVAQFMHLHFYTFNNHIRIHLGYRILADRFEAIALNGPHFQGARVDNLINPKTGARYEFGYNIIGHKEVEPATISPPSSAWTAPPPSSCSKAPANSPSRTRPPPGRALQSPRRAVPKLALLNKYRPYPVIRRVILNY